MSITRSQIARQLLAEGGVSLNDAQTMAPDGEFLAYINPKEAGILKAMGGSGRMTPMGIPSFTEDEEDTGDVSNPGGGSTGGSGGGNNGDDQEDDNARMMQAMGLTGPGFTNRGGGDDPPSFFDRVKSAITRFNPTRFSPTGIITRGLGNLFNKLGNLRGFNPDGTRRTQAQFEQARRDRINQNRISNILGRDAPFTLQTLENLAKLGYTGPLDKSLIGSTNITRSATPDDVYPDRVEGIVTQAPQTFRDAMAQLNLERGVPRDQVFSTRTATGEITNPAIEGFKGFFGIGEGVKDYESLTGNRPEVEKALREGVFDAIKQDALFRSSPNFKGERFTIPETLQIGYDDFKGKGGATTASAYGAPGLQGFLTGAGNQAKGMYAALTGDPNSILNTTLGRSTLSLDPAAKDPAAIQDTYNFGTFLDDVASKFGGGAYKQDIALPEDFSKQVYDIYNQTFDKARQVQNTGINQQIASLYR